MGLTVLSLFDGISGGRIALERAELDIDTYYASEVDKYAIQITQKNHPDTIQLGDVTKWKVWDIDWKSIDLLIGGSPCQDLTFAGKMKGLEGERSSLFYCYRDILNKIKSVNPNVKFLLENVKTKQDTLDIISNEVGVKPVRINSNLLSAQNRDRFYWTNINNGNIPQPEDKGLYLKDIVMEEMDDKFPLSMQHYNAFMKSYPNWKPCLLNEKSKPLLATYYKQPPHCPYIPSKSSPSGYRRLTPVECERLQTLPEGYTEDVSTTQRFKSIGNGWTIDVIAYIFKYIKTEKQ